MRRPACATCCTAVRSVFPAELMPFDIGHLVAAILGLAGPPQAVSGADAPTVLASAMHLPTGIDHKSSLDQIRPRTNVPQVDTSVRANPSVQR